MKWMIRSKHYRDRRNNPKYWSDDVGWTWKDMGTVYTEGQKDQVLLPEGGEWEQQPDV